MLTAIKEITYIRNHQLTIHIPEEFHHKKVEVLILPFSQEVAVTSENNQLDDDFIMLAKFKELQEDASEYNINIPDNVNIVQLTEGMNNAIH